MGVVIKKDSEDDIEIWLEYDPDGDVAVFGRKSGWVTVLARFTQDKRAWLVSDSLTDFGFEQLK
jgi:hypothetical protein